MSALVPAFAAFLMASATGCAASEEDTSSDDSGAEEAYDTGQSEEALVGSEATFIVNKSLRGVKLGMTPTEVRALRGKPDAIEYGVEVASRHYKAYRYAHTYYRFFNDRVYNMIVEGPGPRTETGVHVGSTLEELKAGVPNITCYPENVFCEVPADTRTTWFRLKDGVVIRMHTEVYWNP